MILTLMIGPAAAGKTTWLNSDIALAMGILPHHILGSDLTRADLCGDFKNQAKNGQVFAAINAQARVRLSHCLPTVIDATHLKRQDRLASVSLARGGPVRYIVIDRPMAEKRRDADWRTTDLIAKHDQTFKSQLAEILRGDDLPNVTVHDVRAR